MATRVFKAAMDEAEMHRRGLQEALDAVDKASGEACSTAVVLDLKLAHQRICSAVTFLTPNAYDSKPQSFAGHRPGSDESDFLRRGGTMKARPLVATHRSSHLSE